MRTRSRDEDRRVAVEAMGETLGPVYDELYNDVLWLQTKWGQLRSLFLHSTERRELLNESAPFLFAVLRGVLWEDILLHISRLTDRSSVAGHKNFSVDAVAGFVEDGGLAVKVREIADRAIESAAFARKYRDKTLAHSDLDHVLQNANPLSPVEPDEVEAVLSELRSLVNRIGDHYLHTEVAIEDVRAIGDAEALVARLYAARESRDSDSAE